MLPLRHYERISTENRRFLSNAVSLRSVWTTIQVQGVAPTNHFCHGYLGHECLTTLQLTVFTQRNFVFFKRSAILDGNRPFCVFEIPLGDLRAAYDDHFRLSGKRVKMTSLLVLIELFSLGVTADELRANIGWKSAISFQRGRVDPKFPVEGVAPHEPFSFSEN